jgi:hypothetical protein
MPNGIGRVAGIDRRNNLALDRLELEVRKGSSPPRGTFLPDNISVQQLGPPDGQFPQRPERRTRGC